MSAGASPRLSNYPNGFAYGVNIRGLPLVNAYGGKVWWVDSATGADGNPGTHAQPFATLGRAFTLARAGKGDIIMLRPGHVETISSATAMTLATSGVSVVGLGSGNMRPTFTLDTATTATINITAAGITFANCRFIANFAAIASCFTLGAAASFGVDSCSFMDNSSVLNFVSLITTNTTNNSADGLQLTSSTWFGLGATANTQVIKVLGNVSRMIVQNNYFETKQTTQGAFSQIATGKILVGLICTNNIFNLVGAQAATTGILITTDGTTNSGMLAYNLIQSLDDTTEILVTASSGFRFSQNYYSGAADKSGYLLPAADA